MYMYTSMSTSSNLNDEFIVCQSERCDVSESVMLGMHSAKTRHELEFTVPRQFYIWSLDGIGLTAFYRIRISEE